MGYTMADYQAYIEYCKSLEPSNNPEDMGLDEIDNRIETLENFKGTIDEQLDKLQTIRTKRMQNVKMLIKMPKKQDKIAC